ncbi:MAG TPA: YkgJ family cysteine cluster protein [Polyangiaceae bacterium]|nr:YkgJ family cysteine cluster protein [Polyangiaceae bacterium]
MSRVATHRYADPLDRIWLATAAAVGLRVERTADAYASTPGNGVLLLADRSHLDPDDCLAQMVLHEICHWLVEGKEASTRRDWGLDNETERDVPREHACLRLQASLAGAYGLRRVLAPTTDYRTFYDSLPEDPFSPRLDPTTTLAIFGRRRAGEPPWSPHLARALAATRAVLDAAAAFERAPTADAPELVELLDAAPAPHPTGLPGSPVPARTCGECAWRFGPPGRCRQADGVKVGANTPACERFEPALDCQQCGACCRAAYDCVEVSPRDPVRKKHPELVVVRGPFLEVRRSGDRCAALGGGTAQSTADGTPRFVPFACSIYEDRPKSCRDFQAGGEHCLTARRRVGLSL